MPLFGLPNPSSPDDPAGHALLLAIAFVAVIFVALIVAAVHIIRAIQSWNQAFAPDVADGAARELAQDEPRDIEIPPLNGWSAAITGQMVYGPTPTATKFKPPKTHCALCIIETCDEWGISLDEVRTVGRQKLCKRHQHFDLANARQGAQKHHGYDSTPVRARLQAVRLAQHRQHLACLRGHRRLGRTL